MRSGAAFAMAWNVFKFCTALRALGSIMILLVLSIVGVSYYAVVVAHYGPALVAGGHDSLLALAVLVPFHVLLGLLLWTYFSVVFTDPGDVPPNWKPILDEEIGETALLTGTEQPELTDSATPAIRYCRKCNRLKPPRCHHCSICGRCVLKMDHHCVWVVNCVGALNYKFFLLFLFYTFLETSLVTLSLFPHFLAFFQDVEIPGSPAALATTFLAFGFLASLSPETVAFIFSCFFSFSTFVTADKFIFFLVLNLAFALSVMGFLIMHISLVMKNTTTIEAYEKKATPKWKYDLGPQKNFEQVFGADEKFWFIPAYSHEDQRRILALQGLEYPTKPDFDAQ